MRRLARCLIAAIAVSVLLAPGSAIGQEPGVTFDDGPSSKEYAVPLDAARGETKTRAPAPKAATPAPTKPTPPPAAAPSGSPAADPERKPTPKRSTTTTQDDDTKTAPDVAPAVTADPPSASQALDAEPASSSADGMGAGVLIGALAVAALALGALAGLVLRRRRTAVDQA